MTSPILERTGQPQSAQWTPSAEHFLTPTLFIPCGANLEDLGNLQSAVDRRLEPYRSRGTIRWARPFTAGETVSLGRIAGEIQPLLEHELWQRLVETGDWLQLPDAEHPLRLQFVVVYDAPAAVAEGDVLKFLDQLAKVIAEALQDRVEYSLRLVLLSDLIVDPGKAQAYWPRVRLSSRALGGAQVGRSRVLQVCQHVLVALATSELAQVIEHLVQDKQRSVGWITLGASALVVDLPAMQERLQPQILAGLIRPLLESAPTDAQRRWLDKQIAAQVGAYRDAMFAAASEVAQSDWEIGVQEADGRKGRQVTDCRLRAEAALRPAVFGPHYWRVDKAQMRAGVRRRGKPLIDWVRSISLSPRRLAGQTADYLGRLAALVAGLRLAFVPDRDGLADALAKHYRNLDETLQRVLAERARQKEGNLKNTFAFLLDRGFERPADPSLSLPGDAPLPSGLEAARYAVLRAIDSLFSDSDVIDMRDDRGVAVQPASLGSPEFWEAAAGADADAAYGDALRYRRFARSTASPVGVLLKLIPAWPLLAGLLSLIPSWTAGRAALVAGVSLVAVGVVEVVFWWLVEARRLFEDVQLRSHRYLADRSLSLIAKTLRDYRLLVAARLCEVPPVFDDLHAHLSQKYRGLLSLQPEFSGATESGEEGTLYRLVDFKQVSGWVREAVQGATTVRSKEGGEYDSAVTVLIAKEMWPLARRMASGRAILKTLERMSVEWTRRVFRPDILDASAMAEEAEALQEGKKWRWLWQRAHPLGGDSGGQSAFTVITVADEAALIGTTGKSSPYWGSDWLVARSRQTHEIGCVRGLVEWIEGAEEEYGVA